MRKTCVDKIYDLAKKDSRVVFIGSDLSPGMLNEMKIEMPNRHYMEGVAEMNAVGMAAGMALDGHIPYVNTIATFITRRCYEQVALDVCLHKLPVRLIGNGGGVVYAPLGPTHLAVEDISLMRSLPNMTIVACSDKEEMKRFMDASLKWPDPIYIRLGKGGDPVVSDASKRFEIGKGIMMKEHSKSDLLIVSTGVMTGRALIAGEELLNCGIKSNIMHLHTIKPLDEDLLVEQAKKVSTLVVVEEHSVIGGLGTAVIECLVSRLESKIPRIKKMGLPDKFMENYGVQDDLLDIHQLQPKHIVDTVQDLME